MIKRIATLLLLYCTLLSSTLAQMSGPPASAVRANQQGIDILRSTVLNESRGAQIPWSVMRSWVELRTNGPSWPNQRLFTGGSSLTDLNERLNWTDETQRSLEALRLSLMSSASALQGLNPAILEPTNAQFKALQKQLELVAPPRVPYKLNPLYKASANMRLLATRAVIAPQATTADLLNARTQAQQLYKSLATLSNTDDLGKYHEQADVILRTLNDQAQTQLRSIKDPVDQFRQLASIGMGYANAVAAGANSGQLSVQAAVTQIKSFGEFDVAQSNLISNISVQAQALTVSLNKEATTAQSVWPAILLDVKAAQLGSNEGAAEAIKRAASFSQQFSTLTDVLQGRSNVNLSAASAALSTIGISQIRLASPELTSSLAALATCKGNYASAALGLASSLGISAPPAIKSLLPLMTTAASLFAGGGALSLISGLAGGGSPLSFMGGFGGGGPDYSADFAKIEQELAQVNQRLANIENKLDQLSAQIKTNQEQLISALEGISFDVQRTHTLLLYQVHTDNLKSCNLAARREVSTDPMPDVIDCNKQLDGLYSSQETPQPLTLETNLVTAGLNDNAQKASLLDQSARAYLAKLARGTDCSALLYPSATLDDLSQKLIPNESTGITCDVLMTRRPLLEPGILATYINGEQDALDVSARSPSSIAWWRRNGLEVKKRWNHELNLSSDAVSQQSIMIGDLTLPQLANSVDSQSDIKSLQQLWGKNGEVTVLAENVARYWIWKKLSANPATAPSLYSFAWYSNDARFWTAITGVASPSATFTQETVRQTRLDGTSVDQLIWYVAFPNLIKVPLPPPEEWMHHELRWTNALSQINSARIRIIDQLVGMNYISGLSENKAVELGQAFALASPKTSTLSSK